MAAFNFVQVLRDDARYHVVKIVHSDTAGAEEDDAVKIVASAMSPPCTRFRILSIRYTTNIEAVVLVWDATVEVDDRPAIVLRGGEGDQSVGHFDFRSFGGLWNDAGPTRTGNLAISTGGADASEGYWIVLELQKETSGGVPI